jgi:5'-nucleotidase
MNFFKNPILLYNTKYKIRTALIDYFKETDTIKTELDNRFSYAK